MRCGHVSLRLSQASIIPKLLNIGSCKQRHIAAQGLVFSAKNLNEIPIVSSSLGVLNTG